MSILRVSIIVAIVLAVLTALGIWLGPKAYDKIKDKLPNQKKDETLVRIEIPERGDLVELVQAPGEIEPKTKVDLSARISARIIELPFEEGDEVQAGDVLVRLDGTDLDEMLRATRARRAADAARIEVSRTRIGSMRLSLEGTRATLRQSEIDLERQRELLETGDVAPSVVEDAQRRVDELHASLDSSLQSIKADEQNLIVMQHSLEVADSEIAQAQDRIKDTIIISPIKGVMTALNAEVGELVMTGTMNNAGTVIMQVADLTTMLLIAEVDEADVGTVEVDQKATVRINAYPNREFAGVVESIALTHTLARDGSKYYKTKIILDTGEQRIYSGLTADVDIETKRHDGILKVPSQTVVARPVDSLPLTIRDNNPDVDMTKALATVAYRYQEGKAIVTPVTIGPSDLTHTVVLSGLADEDQVIVGPYKVLESLKHEQEVKDEREAEAEKEEKEREKMDKEKENVVAKDGG